METQAYAVMAVILLRQRIGIFVVELDFYGSFEIQFQGETAVVN